MSGRHLLIRQSVWPRRCYWALLALALWFAWLVPGWLAPVAAPWWLALCWLPVFYLCGAELARPDIVLTLHPQLQFKWVDRVAGVTADITEGRLCAQTQICWLGVWLLWQTADGQTGRRWIFRDALAEADFRLLARTVRQLHWHQTRQTRTQWLR